MAYLNFDSIAQSIQGMHSATAVAAWLLTYFLHSTLFISLSWLICRVLSKRRLRVQELLWKTALIGGIVTASIQPFIHWNPLGRSIVIAENARSTGSISQTLEETWRPSSGYQLNAQKRLSNEFNVTSSPTSLKTTIRAEMPRHDASTKAQPDWALLVAKSMIGLLVIWGGGALLLSFQLAISYGLLARRLKNRQTVRNGPLYKVFFRLLQAAGRIQGLRLTKSTRISIPLARGVLTPEICLPSKVVTDMESEQQETVLAHEMAHALRRDPAWLMVSRIVESIFFLQPLNVVVRRKLQQISEYLCDDWAVEKTGRPIALAKCLTSVAQWNLQTAGPLVVPSMAGSGRHFSDRIARLLDRGYPRPDEARPKWLFVAVGAALLITMITVPSFSGGKSEEGVQSAPQLSSRVSPQRVPPSIAPVVSPAPQKPLAPAVPIASTSLMASLASRSAVSPTAPKVAIAPTAPTAPAQHRTNSAPAPAPSLAPRVQGLSPAPGAPTIAPAPRAPAAPEAQEGTWINAEVEIVELEIAIAEIEAALEGFEAEMEFDIDPEIEISLEQLEAEVERAFEGLDEDLERDLERLEVEIENIDVELDEELMEKMSNVSLILGEHSLEMAALNEHLAAINIAEIQGIRRLSSEETAQLQSEIQRAVKEGIPSVEEIRRIREEALRAASGARLSSEEARALAENARQMGRDAARIARESRPSNEELAGIRASALRAARAARPSREEIEAIRETARQARDEHRVHLEQAREEMRLRRIELKERRLRERGQSLDEGTIDPEPKK